MALVLHPTAPPMSHTLILTGFEHLNWILVERRHGYFTKPRIGKLLGYIFFFHLHKYKGTAL